MIIEIMCVPQGPTQEKNPVEAKNLETDIMNTIYCPHIPRKAFVYLILKITTLGEMSILW